MPQALERVNYASTLLFDAAHLLKNESDSVKGRQMLIQGARCEFVEQRLRIVRLICLFFALAILQGISTLLLTFDESEVRKIVTICQHVLNHLSYVEMIETMDQLVDFVKVSSSTID